MSGKPAQTRGKRHLKRIRILPLPGADPNTVRKCTNVLREHFQWTRISRESFPLPDSQASNKTAQKTAFYRAVKLPQDCRLWVFFGRYISPIRYAC
jgi:hypothetical protein